jgi:hypothetical protein
MKLANTLLLSMIILISVLALSAEDTAIPAVNPVPPAIDNFLKGLGEHSYGMARKWISDDFNLPGVPSEAREMVFKQLFAQWPAPITDYTVESVKKSGSYTGYHMKGKLGTREIQFDMTLDKKDKLWEFSMLGLQAQGQSSNTKRLPVTYAEVPIEMYMGIILTDGELDGVKGKFAIDTGAPTLVLNSKPVADTTRIVLGLSAGAGGAAPDMDARHVNVVKWGGGAKMDFTAITMDLTNLANPDSMNFLGIIGMDLLEPYEVHIDTKNGKMYLYALDQEGKYLDPAVKLKPRKTIPFELDMHIPSFKIKVGNKSVVMGLDTGASSNTLPVKLYDKLIKFYESTAADSAIGVGNEFFDVKTAVLKKCVIGGEDYPGMTFAFVDNPTLGEAEVLKSDGLLGSPFYTRHRLSINYRSKVIGIY